VGFFLYLSMYMHVCIINMKNNRLIISLTLCWELVVFRLDTIMMGGRRMECLATACFSLPRVYLETEFPPLTSCSGGVAWKSGGRRPWQTKKLEELRDLDVVFGVLHAMSEGTLLPWSKNEFSAQLRDVSLFSDILWMRNRPPRARNYIREHTLWEVAFLLLSLRRDLEVDLQVKRSKGFPRRVYVDITLETSSFFVKWDRIPLSAPNDDYTHTNVGETFRRGRSKLGDIRLAATTKEMSDKDDDGFLVLE